MAPLTIVGEPPFEGVGLTSNEKGHSRLTHGCEDLDQRDLDVRWACYYGRKETKAGPLEYDWGKKQKAGNQVKMKRL